MVATVRYATLFSVMVLSGLSCNSAEVKVAWVNCVENDTLVTEKSICYIVDQSGDETTEIKICAGININAGSLIFGGSTSSMLCATVVFGKNEKFDEKSLAKILKKALEEENAKKTAKKEIEKEYEKVEDFSIKKPQEEKKKDLWKRIEDLDTDPFPKVR